MQATTTILTRVAIPGVESEQLQAHQIGQNHFVVASVPFVDTTLAMGDIVECVTVGGAFHVDRVVVRGGASTVRVLPEDPEGLDPDEIAGTLLAFGCRVELGPGGMLVVPPNVEHFAETIGDEPCVDLSIFTPKRDEYAAEESFSA